MQRVAVTMTWDEYESRFVDADGWPDEEARERAVAVATAVGAMVCWIDGKHLPRVEGDWPEDAVCPRCGDTVVEYDFVCSVVREGGPETDVQF